jgi:electron transport complex protein RnfG
MANNKEKKSTILKDAFALTLITIICSFALAFVYEITKEPIRNQADARKNAGYKVVFADAKSLVTDEELVKLSSEIDLSTLDSDFAGVTIDDVVQALDDNGNIIGYIIATKTRGYASTIKVAVGYSLDGTVQGIELLEIGDTPGFGMNADTPEFKSKFAGVQTNQFVVTKSGSSTDNEIDVVSSATITTEAVVRATNAGIGFLVEKAEDLGGAINE